MKYTRPKCDRIVTEAAFERLSEGRLRVAFIAGGLGAGVCNLLPELATRTDLTLITASNFDVDPGLRTLTVGDGRQDYITLSRQLCAKAQQLVDAQAVDLVHGNSSREYLVTGIPKVAQPRGCIKANEMRQVESRPMWIRWLYRISKGRGLSHVEGKSLRTSSCIIAVSNANSQELKKYWHLPSNKVHVVYNALPNTWLKENWSVIDQSMPCNKSPCAYFAGRFCVEKPIVDVVRAWVRSNLKTRLMLLGPTRADVESIVPEAVGDTRIVCRGWVKREDLLKTLEPANILVHPSLREGFSMSILEAMCMGKCVVAYDIPPVREAVGKDGFLLPPGSVDSVIRTIHKLECQPTLIREMGHQLYRKRLSFTPRASVDGFLKVYGNALSAFSSSPF